MQTRHGLVELPTYLDVFFERQLEMRQGHGDEALGEGSYAPGES